MHRITRFFFSSIVFIVMSIFFSVGNVQASQEASISIPSSSYWVNTGLTVSTGDRLTITATGSWTAAVGAVPMVGPDGSTQQHQDNFLNLTDFGTCCGASTLTPHWQALIGYIGSNPPYPGSYFSTNATSDILKEAQKIFVVGSNYNEQAPNSGKLWLNFNDDAYSANNSDNQGQVMAQINLTRNKTPLVIVPGIMASWNWGVILDAGDLGWDWAPDGGGDSWRQFIDSLEKAGYQKDKDYFIAFYDWRKTNDWTSSDPDAALPAKKYLAEAIDKAKTANPGISKVNIVAHSLGGLVARSYVESPYYRGDIDKAIFIGTPNAGAVFAYYPWEGGRIPPNWDSKQKAELTLALQLIARRYFGDPYQLIHDHMKGIKDLLPVGYNYLSQDGQFIDWTGMNEVNNFLKNTSNPQNTASIFANKGVNLINITGTGYDTWQSLQVSKYLGTDSLWKDGQPQGSASTADGDNTVLASSSNLSGLQSLTVNSQHGNLPNAATQLVFNKLGITYTPSYLAGAPDSVMTAWVASPVTLTVLDSQGNSVGQSFTDPTGEMKWVYVENPSSNYKIKLVGTGNGQYHVGVDYYTQTVNANLEKQGIASTSATYNYSVTINPQDSQPLKLEEATPPAHLQAVSYRWGSPAPGYSYKWPFFEGWQQVKIQNDNHVNVLNVKATVDSTPPNMQILDGEVTLGNINTGQAAWSSDTFRTKTDMSKPADKCAGITWKIEYDTADGSHYILPHVPQFPPGQAPGGC